MNLSECSPDNPHPHDHSPPYKLPDGPKKDDWTIIVFLVAIAFACVMFISAAFIYYHYVRRNDHRLRAAERHHRRRRRVASGAVEDLLASPTGGLGGAMVDTLPVFVYTPENFNDGLRCAVCLCEFQQSEKGRLLPSCNHSFHVDCIGMWFYSHSTCPLCRTKVEKQSDTAVVLDRSQMELSLIEEEKEEEGGGGGGGGGEAGEKAILGSTSASPAADQHGNGGVKHKDDDVGEHSKEEKGEHVSIDLGHQRKPASSSITSPHLYCTD